MLKTLIYNINIPPLLGGILNFHLIFIYFMGLGGLGLSREG